MRLPAAVGYIRTKLATKKQHSQSRFLRTTNRMTKNATQLTPEYASGVVLLFVQFFGSFGNLLVIFSILRQRRLLHSNYYYLVLHLASCDLFSLLNSVELIHSGWAPNLPFIRSAFMCKVWTPMFTLFFTAGVHFMVLIAVFRYRAVVYPLKPAVRRWKLRVIVAFVYVFVVICLIPLFWALNFSEETAECIDKWPSVTIGLAFSLCLTAIQYYIPIAVLAVVYSKICKTLLEQNEAVKMMNSSHTVQGTQTPFERSKHFRNLRTLYVSMAIVVSFGITAFPLHTWWLILVRGKIRYDGKHERWLLVVYMTGTCAVNPFIYGIFDKSLLAAFKQIWRRVTGTCRSRSTENAPHSNCERTSSSTQVTRF